MKKLRNLEEFLLYEDFIRADDNFISNGHFIISKKYIKSKALKIAKNTDNIWEECKETIPYEKGNDFDCTSTGTECRLYQDETIGIVYNDLYKFDYEYVAMINHQLPYWLITEFCVVENKRGEPVLKFFIGDEIVACLMSMKNKK